MSSVRTAAEYRRWVRDCEELMDTLHLTPVYAADLQDFDDALYALPQGHDLLEQFVVFIASERQEHAWQSVIVFERAGHTCQVLTRGTGDTLPGEGVWDVQPFDLNRMEDPAWLNTCLPGVRRALKRHADHLRARA